jgi:hypothetical protein
MSDWYEVAVSFVTGAELNAPTKTTTYGAADAYAVVYWAPD